MRTSTYLTIFEKNAVVKHLINVNRTQKLNQIEMSLLCTLSHGICSEEDHESNKIATYYLTEEERTTLNAIRVNL